MMLPTMNCDHLEECENERFAIQKFTVSREGATIHNLRVAIDGTGRRISPGTYTKLVEKGHGLWMSDTPAEQQDHIVPLREMASRGGDVLIMGLGIGMVVAAALKLDSVKRVVVIERERAVISLVEPQIRHAKLTVVEADALEFRPWALEPVLDEGYHLSVMYADVWQDLNVDNLKIYGNLKRRWAMRSDFRWCWGEDFLKRHRDRRR